MSAIVGCNLTGCVVLLADTRRNFYPRDSPKYHKDGFCKIAKFSFGLFAATGYLPAVDAVKAALGDQSNPTASEIVAIIKREQARISGEDSFLAHSPEARMMLQKSVRLWSYAATPARVDLVALMGGDASVVKPGYVAASIPPKMKDYASEIESQLRPLTFGRREQSWIEDIGHDLQCLSRIIKVAADRANDVSPEFHVGIHWPSKEPLISGPFPCGHDLKWFFK